MTGEEAATPTRADARAFERVPEVGVIEQLVVFFGGYERPEGETVIEGECAVVFAGDEGDAVAASAQGDAEADIGEDVAVGAQGGEDDVGHCWNSYHFVANNSLRN